MSTAEISFELGLHTEEPPPCEAALGLEFIQNISDFLNGYGTDFSFSAAIKLLEELL